MLHLFRRNKPEPVLITDGKHLSIDGFISCLFHKDYTPLIVSGYPAPEAISARWGQIFEEYAALIESFEYVAIRDIYRELIKLKSKQIVVLNALVILPLRYDREIALQVKSVGYNLVFNPENPIQYEQSINRLVSNAKTLSMRIQMEEKEIERQENEGKKKDANTENDFVDGILTISQHLGYPINTKTVSITEYAAMQRNYMRYCDRMKAKEKNKDNG